MARTEENNTLERPRKVGLARALSKLGWCSRGCAAELILAGRVRVNGGVRRDPETPVRIGKDHFEVDGQPVQSSEKIYLLLNKPRGVVTTASDEQGRKTVYDFIDKSLSWVAPVGRLDKASEGLLLLSNDSEWAGKITAPGTRLEKTYHVQIATLATAALLKQLETGLQLHDEFLRVKRASLLRSGQRHSWLEIILDEGKNRHIRRMFEHLNIEVLRLVRVAIGSLLLGDLAKGTIRKLSETERVSILEINSHRHAAGKSAGIKT